MEKTYLDDIEATAKALYQHSIDMDYADYEEQQNDTLTDLQEALWQIKAIAQNEYNNDFWRTFARCLDLITENTIINETFFQGVTV
jgi:hypothetical protein